MLIYFFCFCVQWFEITKTHYGMIVLTMQSPEHVELIVAGVIVVVVVTCVVTLTTVEVGFVSFSFDRIPKYTTHPTSNRMMTTARYIPIIFKYFLHVPERVDSTSISIEIIMPIYLFNFFLMFSRNQRKLDFIVRQLKKRIYVVFAINSRHVASVCVSLSQYLRILRFRCVRSNANKRSHRHVRKVIFRDFITSVNDCFTGLDVCF